VSAQAACTIEVRAVPGGSRDVVAGRVGTAFKVKVRAPAVDGKANEAVCRFLAQRLGLPRSHVRILRGETARLKTLRIEGIGLVEAERRLLPCADERSPRA